MSANPAPLSSRPILATGTQLNALYEIDALIAVGGMGEIYRGHAIQTGDPVAIKLIRSDLDGADTAFALFRKEAAALHNLYHEAIVRYYVFAIDPVLERPYLAMEFVDGQSLATILRQGPLSSEVTHALMVRIASGLQAAHARGIIHRDISPDNIIIPGGDVTRAKIIDFGIARSMGLDREATIIGSGFAGKYNYVSPEQLGLFGGEVTPKSDIYSLALVLVETLRRKPLDMAGTHAELIEKHRKLPNLADIDPRWQPLLTRMLQPDPRNRPASMAEIAAWRLPILQPRAPARETAAAPRLRGSARDCVRNPPPKFIASKFIAPKFIAMGLALSVAMALTLGGYVLLPSHHTLVAPRAVQAIGPAGTSGLTKSAAAAQLLKGYDGGPCFFVKPLRVAEEAAYVEGYGKERPPFDDLDEAFRRAVGFEAAIGVHQVEAAQCPALALLGATRNAPSPPNIVLEKTALIGDEALSGTIEGVAGREVQLVLVADDGSARSLEIDTFAADDDKRPFHVTLDPSIANGKLQLLVAIASAKPLASLAKNLPGAAEELFVRVLDEARDPDLAVASSLRSFKLDK